MAQRSREVAPLLTSTASGSNSQIPADILPQSLEHGEECMHASFFLALFLYF